MRRAALFAVGLALSLAAPAGAQESQVKAAVEALTPNTTSVYVHPDAASGLGADDVADLGARVEEIGFPVEVAVLGDVEDPRAALDTLTSGLGEDAGTVVLSTNGDVLVASSGLTPEEVARVADAAAGTDLLASLRSVIAAIGEEHTTLSPGTIGPPPDFGPPPADDTFVVWIIAVLAILAAGGGAWFLRNMGWMEPRLEPGEQPTVSRIMGGLNASKPQPWPEVQVVRVHVPVEVPAAVPIDTEPLRRRAREDVVVLGEAIRDLDLDMEMPATTSEAKQAYSEALGHYERASAAVGRVEDDEVLADVRREIEDGAFAMARTEALLAGRPAPSRRPACFFDGRHGPSTRDLPWSPPGGLARLVALCEACAVRLEDEARAAVPAPE